MGNDLWVFSTVMVSSKIKKIALKNMFSPFSWLVAFSLNYSMDLLSIEKNIAIADVASFKILNVCLIKKMED